MSSQRLDTLAPIFDRVEEWGSYAALHPTHPYTDEWARELLGSLLVALEEEA